MRKIIILITALLLCEYVSSQRSTLDLTKATDWKVWLDKEAEWKEDQLFLPNEFSLSQLPQNPPTCGWDTLFREKGKNCNIPTTIEEQFGTSHDWTYHGVSWFYKTITIPSEWRNKKVFFKIEKYNHRIEVFVNGKLVGYDAVGLLPYECDITKEIISNQENRLALRITGVGGGRGWEDFHPIVWGEQTLLPDKDYSGIGGKITLTAVDTTFISDVFVKNLLPAKANNIEVETTIKHTDIRDTHASYTITIREQETGKTVLENTFSCTLQNGTNQLNRVFTIPEAKQWDEHNPILYTCQVTLKTPQSKDTYKQVFGFRVFEIKERNGRTHFFLNGKRIRFRSAIDWSLYAYNGMFPTDEVALKSIKAVKELGHNSLNFHRRAGDIALFKKADSLGVYIYEEPGGFHSGGQANCNIDTFSFAKKQLYERLSRMVLRDRNHPSLLIYSLCNEDNKWTHAREMGMRIIHKYDSTRLIINSSGGNNGGFSIGGVPHIRPYEQEIRQDYHDHHTVQAEVALAESDLNREMSETLTKEGQPIDHVSNDSSSITYWGEVRCYAGTFNYPLLYKQGTKNGKGYDLSMYASQAQKTKELFDSCYLKHMKKGGIQSVDDLTRYAGQGQYYADGRLEQVIMSNDLSDGYAINGWSPGPDMPDEWSSALLDQNRNMNSFAKNLSYWNRPLQIAIMRLNGKYFQPGDTIKTNIFLINENQLSAGKYTLRLKIKDGNGDYVGSSKAIEVKVTGGDVYAQTICKEYAIKTEPSWTSGYITIEGKLYKEKKFITDGTEQVLLQNRPSQSKRFKQTPIAVINWPKAEKALQEAHIAFSNTTENASVILLGKQSSESAWETALQAVKKGANLIIQFDSIDSNMAIKHHLLNTPIKAWGGLQTPYWNGNGSSFIDIFPGDQAFTQSGIISTRSWEAYGNPKGFFPFRSNHKQRTYGVYFAHQYKRNPNFKTENNTLVTYGEIEYGKGRILFNTSYWVDEENAFTDLLFFNMLYYYGKR